MIAFYMLREVVRLLLLFSEYSNRYIEKVTCCTHQTVGIIRHKLIELDIKEWPDIVNLTDDELKSVFYPNLKFRNRETKAPLDLEEIIRQLTYKGKRRKSKIMCIREYRLKHGKDNAYSIPRCYQLINQHLKSHHVVMKQFYHSGECLFIDYAGTKLKYRVRGKDKLLSVFVGCLGYSKKTFAFATEDMTSKSWILGLTKALEYFGGVPEVIQFDNAKAMVIKPSRLALLNDNARALAQYYGCICDTSRVATPTDNANAENAVKIVTQKILVMMNQDLQFFSLKEVNEYLLQAINKLNEAPFQKQPNSRNILFEEDEKQALLPLPTIPFKPFVVQKKVKVPSTYLIPYQGYEYSVPYTLVGKEVMIRVTETEFQAFHNGGRVATHVLSEKLNGFTRLPEHMKPAHLAEENKSKETFMAWAHEVSEDVEAIIEKQYSLTSNVKSRAVGKRCLTLQKLCDKCGKEVFSKACHYALEHDWFDPCDIELVIRAEAWEHDESSHNIVHKNIRGKDYYVGGYHD